MTKYYSCTTRDDREVAFLRDSGGSKLELIRYDRNRSYPKNYTRWAKTHSPLGEWKKAWNVKEVSKDYIDLFFIFTCE